VDARTIKIPVPKLVANFRTVYCLNQAILSRPTVDSRNALYTQAQRKAEEIRVQVRKQHSVSIKKGKYEKFSIELEEASWLFYLSFPGYLPPILVSEA
jgi:ribosome recycling factor